MFKVMVCSFIFGEKTWVKVAITDESMGVSQLLEGHAPGQPPKVYAYDHKTYT